MNIAVKVATSLLFMMTLCDAQLSPDVENYRRDGFIGISDSKGAPDLLFVNMRDDRDKLFDEISLHFNPNSSYDFQVPLISSKVELIDEHTARVTFPNSSLQLLQRLSNGSFYNKSTGASGLADASGHFTVQDTSNNTFMFRKGLLVRSTINLVTTDYDYSSAGLCEKVSRGNQTIRVLRDEKNRIENISDGDEIWKFNYLEITINDVPYSFLNDLKNSDDLTLLRVKRDDTLGKMLLSYADVVDKRLEWSTSNNVVKSFGRYEYDYQSIRNGGFEISQSIDGVVTRKHTRDPNKGLSIEQFGDKEHTTKYQLLGDSVEVVVRQKIIKDLKGTRKIYQGYYNDARLPIRELSENGIEKKYNYQGKKVRIQTFHNNKLVSEEFLNGGRTTFKKFPTGLIIGKKESKW